MWIRIIFMKNKRVPERVFSFLPPRKYVIYRMGIVVKIPIISVSLIKNFGFFSMYAVS